MTRRRYVLKRDVVIPAGTILEDFSSETMHLAHGWAGKILGLTQDSHGYFLYDVDSGDKAMGKWLDEITDDR